MIGAGINSGVSSQAKPNIKPWSPAPCSEPSFPLAFFASTPCEMSCDWSVMTVLTKIFFGVKHVVVVDVTDLAHRIAHDLVDRDDVFQMLALRQIRNRDLTADDHDVALGVGLAGHAALAILPEAGVQDGVGNGVANFVRMAFANGFGSKNETSKHVLGIQVSVLRVQERTAGLSLKPEPCDETSDRHIDRS